MELSLKFVNSTAYPGRCLGGALFLDPAPVVDGITRAVRCGFWFHVLRLVYIEVRWQPKMIVHYTQGGRTPCGMAIPPGDTSPVWRAREVPAWPKGQLWTFEPAEVTCHACLAGLESIGLLTFEIDPDGKWIKCLGCGLTSHHSEDVRHHFCGHCHVFHDDLWPPARKWWIENTEKVVDAQGERLPDAKVGIERC